VHIDSVRIAPWLTVAKSREWPFTLPAVKALMGAGLDLTAPVTFLVGDNGSGKSTIVEAVAEACGVDVRGGHGGRKYASPIEKGVLGGAIHLERGSRDGGHVDKAFFLRSETALGVFTFMSDHGVSGYGDYHLADVSHGEGYLQVLGERFGSNGLLLLDEPEAGLSYTACLSLMQSLDATAKAGGQVICATHSPVLTALPDADIWLVSAEGIERTSWTDLEMVEDWRVFLANPDSVLRHLLGRSVHDHPSR
jgi:predicted ATPase